MKRNASILLFDIESTSLFANVGYCLCIGYKWVGHKRTKIISIHNSPGYKDNPTDDLYLIKEFSRVIESADLAVSWYGKRFDEPFLQTRALIHQQKPLVFPTHLDLWETARYKLKMSSNRLDTVTKSLFFDDHKLQEFKTPLIGLDWMRAAAGIRKSLDKVIKHCLVDVDILGSTFNRMKPFIFKMPNVYRSVFLKNKFISCCPSCGSKDYIKKGFGFSEQQAKQRWVCRDCGKNFYTSLNKEPSP
jgi:uncharacterized protein YprB with RNaseH-like and TPR domain